MAGVWAFLLIMLLPAASGEEGCSENSATSEAAGMVLVPSGRYEPFISSTDTVLEVPSFYLDKYPVTNRQFNAFLQERPEWNRENVKRLFADEGYLRHWEQQPSANMQSSPVTNISWHAAQAYCECQGKRLPTIDEWEYAASSPLILPANEEAKISDDVVLKWYSSATEKALPPVGSTYQNELGIYDMHGLIWEWVYDFNSVMLPRDTRGKKELEQFYCGAAVIGAADPSDYASFIRFGLRSSLSASYTLQNLGFRCAKDSN